MLARFAGHDIDLPGLEIAARGRAGSEGEQLAHLRFAHRRVEIGARGDAGGQGLTHIHQTEKLVPQPQAAVALGLWILKEAPISSST